MSNLNELPYDVYHRMLSVDEFGVREIRTLKQTCRALRIGITSLLAAHPALYQTKLNLLARRIPTGLPKDLSSIAPVQLEVAALSSLRVEQHWRTDHPTLCCAPRIYHADSESDHPRDTPKVTALKVLPGGRWIIAALQPGSISVWDTLIERLVVQYDDCVAIDWIEVDITDPEQREVMMVVGGAPTSEPVLEHALVVYSLHLDPSPTARDRASLHLAGYIASPSEVHNPAIKSPLACATYFTEVEHGILIYDWQREAGKILIISTIISELGLAPSLTILPGYIFLYQRFRPSPSIYIFEIPELDPLPEDDESQPPLSITVSPVVAQAVLEHDLPLNQLQYLSSVVEDLTSSMTYLTALSLQSDGSTGESLSKHRINLDMFRVATKEHVDVLAVPFKDPFRRAVRVCSSVATAGSMYEGQGWRPLMAMGQTGRRAIWVEESLESGRGGLVGFTVPPIHASSDLEKPNGEGSFTNDLRDPAYDRTERQQQTPENYEGDSPLRRLRAPALYSFADITALGFDESTATVAVGDAWGRVWVLNYAPPPRMSVVGSPRSEDME